MKYVEETEAPENAPRIPTKEDEDGNAGQSIFYFYIVVNSSIKLFIDTCKCYVATLFYLIKYAD